LTARLLSFTELHEWKVGAANSQSSVAGLGRCLPFTTHPVSTSGTFFAHSE